MFPNEDPHSKTLYSIQYQGHAVVSVIKFGDDNTISVDISATDAGLASALAKEVSLKLKTY